MASVFLVQSFTKISHVVRNLMRLKKLNSEERKTKKKVMFKDNILLSIFITWPRSYKTLFMLNSAEQEILNVISIKDSKKFGFFTESNN